MSLSNRVLGEQATRPDMVDVKFDRRRSTADLAHIAVAFERFAPPNLPQDTSAQRSCRAVDIGRMFRRVLAYIGIPALGRTEAVHLNCLSSFADTKGFPTLLTWADRAWSYWTSRSCLCRSRHLCACLASADESLASRLVGVAQVAGSRAIFQTLRLLAFSYAYRFATDWALQPVAATSLRKRLTGSVSTLRAVMAKTRAILTIGCCVGINGIGFAAVATDAFDALAFSRHFKIITVARFG